LLGVSDIRQGSDRLARTLCEIANSRSDAVACDAETDQDLALIAQGILSAGVPTVWSGSAGLMRQAARILGSGSARVATPAPARGPLLLVVGSASDVSHAQFELLAAEPCVAAVRVAPDDLRGPPGSSSLLDLESQLDAAIGLGSDTAMLIERGSTLDTRAGAQLVMALAAVVAPRLGGIGGLVATGGETARGLLEAAGAAGIRLGGEIEPGVPWGRTMGDIVLPIVTKAGAYGNSRTLLRCRNALKGVVA
jgi:D-threonate/D-erythronate kinase